MIRSFLPVLCLVAVPLAAQVTVTTDPAEPARGSLIRLHVTAEDAAGLTSIRGEAAGEPLQLGTNDGVTWSGFAGVPVDGDDTLPLLLILNRGVATDTVRTALAVSQPGYPSEKLTVAPRMAEPDSAARVRIKRDIARAREVGREAHDAPRFWQGPFILPRPTRVTSRFGTGREFNGKVTSRHLGTDFSGATGAPVRATNRGRVALVADFYLAGKVIYLEHGDGLVSAYFHLSRARVKPGDIVEKGQIIGAVGQSGRVTGPHLHWVMRYGNVTIDPTSVVRLTAGGER